MVVLFPFFYDEAFFQGILLLYGGPGCLMKEAQANYA